MKRADYQEIIDTLIRGNFYAECPNCREEIRLQKAGLFSADNLSERAIQIREQQLEMVRRRREALLRRKELGASRSLLGARSVNIGKILERLAPTLGSFRFNHNDCRALFDPIDYIIFEGLSSKNRVNKLFFIDIKTGAARLSRVQKAIKTVVNSGKVRFKTY